MTETTTDNKIKIEDLLEGDGPVAIIIKQPLAPVDEDDRVIFPPTYPMTKWKGRVHTVRDGEYTVTVELPTGNKTDKDEKKDNQKAGYQIDRFPDGTNICEIDSPQSQSNRIEPKFKTIAEGKLVPQVEIKVGTEKVNLLDVGHRAGDALVRMSSLAAEIHEAFTAGKKGDFFKLATIAPTSLVFGVWDSRSTQVKQQRVFKAYIRATDIRELSRSAQYTPAAAYVDVGAIGDDVERKEGKEGDDNNLSQEGMLHALSTQTVGGVMLTERSRLVRTVTVNLEAIRALRGSVTPSVTSGETANPVDGTEALRRYILGLALVAAFDEPDLNLREGCHLKYADKEAVSSGKLIYRAKKSEDCPFTVDHVLEFAKEAKSAFFKLSGIEEGSIDRRHVTFEKGVAERFLAYPKIQREKIRKLGPITKGTLDRFDAQGKDPFKAVTEELKKVKENLGKKPRKNEAPLVKREAFETLAGLLDALAAEETLPAGASELPGRLAGLAREHDNSHEVLNTIEREIKEYKKSLKDGPSEENPSPDAEAGE